MPENETVPLDWADAQAVTETAELVKRHDVKPIEASTILLAGALREITRQRTELVRRGQLLTEHHPDGEHWNQPAPAPT